MSLSIEPQWLSERGAPADQAAELSLKIRQILGNNPPVEAWQTLCREVLEPLPFEIHQDLFHHLEASWDHTRGPFPAWSPSADTEAATNATAFLRKLGLENFQDLFYWSTQNRDAFWQAFAETISLKYKQTPSQICDLSNGIAAPDWLPGALLNITDTCFGAEPEATAVVYRSTENGPLEKLTYDQLNKQSNRVANSLIQHGFQSGDAIAIDMTMTVESVIIYLGIIKAGCAVISIADSFSPEEIAVRLRIGKARGIFTMDVLKRGSKTLPMYEKVCKAEAPRAIVLPADDSLSLSLREGDCSWDDFLVGSDQFESVAADTTAVINILFSSGTTGDPKAIPWSHATPLKGAMDAHFHHDIQPGDVVCWPTNLGWMMGPWLIFASLLNKAAIALYHDAPIGAGFCRFVQDASVTMLGVVPSIVKAWKNANALNGLDWSSIRCFSSTGECSNAEDMLWLMSKAGYKPIMEYCGGTEIGGGYLCGSFHQPASPSTFTTPTLGLDILLLDDQGKPAEEGEVYIIPPSMGLSTTLLNKNHYQVYFEDTPPGPNGEVLRRHGDQLEKIGGGYWRALGRADDTMNLGGIKTSSAEIERVLKTVEGIDETAAIAVPPKGGGPSMLVIFAVLIPQASDQDLAVRLQKAVRSQLNPLFKIADVKVVGSLPRTASGKVMRRILRKQYQAGQ